MAALIPLQRRCFLQTPGLLTPPSVNTVLALFLELSHLFHIASVKATFTVEEENTAEEFVLNSSWPPGPDIPPFLFCPPGDGYSFHLSSAKHSSRDDKLKTLQTEPRAAEVVCWVLKASSVYCVFLVKVVFVSFICFFFPPRVIPKESSLGQMAFLSWQKPLDLVSLSWRRSIQKKTKTKT